jgi:DNA processing protein
LRLSRTETIGPISFYAMLSRFGSARAALEVLPRLARRGERTKTVTAVTRAEAEIELAALHRIGAQLVCWGEPLYPSALAAIEDAPPILTVLGQAELLQRPMIAVVGARNASANGRRFARDLAASLGRGGLTVISGLARGIDAAAHLGGLETGSVAVVAGGVDVVYPAENRGLYDALARQGVIVAELPLGTEPQARHFPRRNRIISGMALGVVVVEAAARSGSLITARFRPRARARGLRGAGLAARSAGTRLQRFAAARCDPDRDCRGRAVAARGAAARGRAATSGCGGADPRRTIMVAAGCNRNRR